MLAIWAIVKVGYTKETVMPKFGRRSKERLKGVHPDQSMLLMILLNIMTLQY